MTDPIDPIDPTDQPASDAPAPGKSRRGGARPGSGRKPGYRKRTITRQHLIRQQIAFDAHEAVFAGMTPLEMMQICVWRLLGEGRWFEAGIVAGRMAPYHHHRKPTTSIALDRAAALEAAAAALRAPAADALPPKVRPHGLTQFPERLPPEPEPIPAPEPDPPLPPVRSERLSERRTGTEPKNLPSNAAVQVLLTPEAVTMLVPSLREELVDPRNPYAHWGDFNLMHNHLMNRRIWQKAEEQRLRDEREAHEEARRRALRAGTEPPPPPPALEKKQRPSRSKKDQSERLWERWRTHPLVDQARALGMLDQYDRPYEQAVYFKSLGPLEIDES